MRLSKCLIPLVVCAMLQPIHAKAERVIPDAAVELAYSVGELEIRFDRNYNGASFAVYRVLPEGEFQYYRYQARLADESELVCPLIEGDYQLAVTLPDEDTQGHTTKVYEFTIPDPDMDEMQSFDKTIQTYTFTTSPDIAEDVFCATELENTGRTLYRSVQCTLARRDFVLGDVNGDGLINVSDASAILYETTGRLMGVASLLTALQTVEGDVNGDGDINVTDAREVLVYSSIRLMEDLDGDLLDHERQLVTPPMPE